MSRSYSVVDDQNVTVSPGDTVITIQSAVTIRPALYELILGTTGTPADNALDWLVRRFDTDDGTGDALTPRPLDTLDAASSITALGNHTVEPSSFTMTLMELGIHQRATFHWRAAAGKAFVCPAVATEGIAVTPIHASYTGLATCTLFFEE